MPYSERFENALRARAHGARLSNPKLNKIGQAKAQSMIAEAASERRKKGAKK